MSKRRRYERTAKDQNSRADNYFDELLKKFHGHLFTVDFDNNPLAKRVDIFAMYDRSWRTYANEWNSKKGRVVLCDLEAFTNYAINQDIDDTALAIDPVNRMQA